MTFHEKQLAKGRQKKKEEGGRGPFFAYSQPFCTSLWRAAKKKGKKGGLKQNLRCERRKRKGEKKGEGKGRMRKFSFLKQQLRLIERIKGKKPRRYGKKREKKDVPVQFTVFSARKGKGKGKVITSDQGKEGFFSFRKEPTPKKKRERGGSSAFFFSFNYSLVLGRKKKKRAPGKLGGERLSNLSPFSKPFRGGGMELPKRKGEKEEGGRLISQNLASAISERNRKRAGCRGKRKGVSIHSSPTQKRGEEVAGQIVNETKVGEKSLSTLSPFLRRLRKGKKEKQADLDRKKKKREKRRELRPLIVQFYYYLFNIDRGGEKKRPEIHGRQRKGKRGDHLLNAPLHTSSFVKGGK